MSTTYPPIFPQQPSVQTPPPPQGSWAWNGSQYVWQQAPPPPPPPPAPPAYPAAFAYPTAAPAGKPDPLQLIAALLPIFAPQLGLPAQALQLLPVAIGLAETLRSGAAGPDKLAFAMQFITGAAAQYIPGFGDDKELVAATSNFVSALVNHFNRTGVLQKSSAPAAQEVHP